MTEGIAYIELHKEEMLNIYYKTGLKAKPNTQIEVLAT